MKAPICRLCETAHWNNEPHDLSKLVTAPVTCNQCVTKDAEIERLRNQLANAVRKAEALLPAEAVKKAKRDRAAYMRKRRAGAKAGAS